MKRLISWLLALTLICGLLPMSVFAVEIETDGDSDLEVDFGGELTPITVDWEWNETNTEATASVTVPAGKTYSFQYYGDNTMVMTVDGVEFEYTPAASRYEPNTFSLTNEGTEEYTYALTLSYAAGTQMNPVELVIGDNVSTHAEAGAEFYYTYTADQTGTLVLNLSTDAAGWFYCVNNLTTYKYGDGQWSDSDPVVNPAEIEVTEGDELEILVNTYDPANEWTAPAGTVTINASYKPEGPIADPNLKFMKAGLSLQDYIGFTFSMMTNVTAGYDEVYVELLQTTPKGVDKYTLDSSTLGPLTLYVHNVQSWSMTEELEVTIYGLKGHQLYIGQSLTTSVRDQALSTMPSADAKTKRVIVDMLTYGAAVQTEFGYNTDKLANADLEQLGYASFGTTTIPTLVDNSSTSGTGSYTVSTKGLSLQARVDLTLMFTKGDMSAYEAHIAFADTTDIVKGSTFSEVAPGMPMRILSLSFAPYRLRENFTVTIHEIATGNVVSPAYTMSVENIAESKLGQDDGVDAIIYALMNYGDAVLEFMG